MSNNCENCGRFVSSIFGPIDELGEEKFYCGDCRFRTFIEGLQ